MRPCPTSLLFLLFLLFDPSLGSLQHGSHVVRSRSEDHSYEESTHTTRTQEDWNLIDKNGFYTKDSGFAPNKALFAAAAARTKQEEREEKDEKEEEKDQQNEKEDGAESKDEEERRRKEDEDEARKKAKKNSERSSAKQDRGREDDRPLRLTSLRFAQQAEMSIGFFLLTVYFIGYQQLFNGNFAERMERDRRTQRLTRHCQPYAGPFCTLGRALWFLTLTLWGLFGLGVMAETSSTASFGSLPSGPQTSSVSVSSVSLTILDLVSVGIIVAWLYLNLRYLPRRFADVDSRKYSRKSKQTVSGTDITCAGTKKLETDDLAKCRSACNECVGCAAFVYHFVDHYCSFKLTTSTTASKLTDTYVIDW